MTLKFDLNLLKALLMRSFEWQADKAAFCRGWRSDPCRK